MSAEAAAVARRAAEIIQERGKATGAYQDKEGRVCLIGALHMAEKGSATTPGQTAVELAAYDFFDRENICAGSITTWNDNPATTELDVAKVLLQLADRLEVAP